MSIPSPESSKQSKLRQAAEARLQEGSAPPSGGWRTGASALNMLHKLAGTPESAHDALKLLHELQVHQVELDLQHDQMELTQRELAADLARYQAFYDFAPVAYLVMGHAGDILECNEAAAGLFAVARDELRGRRIGVFLAPESRPVLVSLLERLRAGGTRDICEVRSGPRQLQLIASVAPDGGSILAVLVDTADRTQSDPRV